MGYTVRELALMRIEEVEKEIQICEKNIEEDKNVSESIKRKKAFERELENLGKMV